MRIMHRRVWPEPYPHTVFGQLSCEFPEISVAWEESAVSCIEFARRADETGSFVKTMDPMSTSRISAGALTRGVVAGLRVGLGLGA